MLTLIIISSLTSVFLVLAVAYLCAKRLRDVEISEQRTYKEMIENDSEQFDQMCNVAKEVGSTHERIGELEKELQSAVIHIGRLESEIYNLVGSKSDFSELEMD